LIKELYNVWWVIRYALKFWTKAFWYDWIKRYRCSRMTAIDYANKKITVNDWADFQPWELVKLWYHTKQDNFETNYIKSVNIATMEVELSSPLVNSHLSWEWCSLEHWTGWQDWVDIFTTGIKLSQNAAAGATIIKVSNSNQAVFLYNMVWSTVKLNIGTYEEHFKVSNVIWNDVYVYQDIVHTHEVWEWLDDSKLYIDKGHDLSNDPDMPAFVWFEKEENIWDVVVWLANSDWGKISCKWSTNDVFLLWNWLNNTFITTDRSNYCMVFNDLKRLSQDKNHVTTFSDEYFSDQTYNVWEWTIWYNTYNSIIEDWIKASTSYDECINYCKVNPQIRMIDQTDRTIWNLYTSIAIAPNSSATFTIECNDPIDTYIVPFIWDWNYTAMSQPDWTWVDMTSYISNIEIITPTSAKQFDIRVTSSASTKIYLNKFELQGRLYVLHKDDRNIALYKDITAIKDNWLYPIEINNKYVNNLFYSQDFAQNLVNLYKWNYEKRQVTLIWNISIEVWDVIRIYSSIFRNDFKGTVLRVSHSFSESEWFITSFELWLLKNSNYVEWALLPPSINPPQTLEDSFVNTTFIDIVNTTATVDIIDESVYAKLQPTGWFYEDSNQINQISSLWWAPERYDVASTVDINNTDWNFIAKFNLSEDNTNISNYILNVIESSDTQFTDTTNTDAILSVSKYICKGWAWAYVNSKFITVNYSTIWMTNFTFLANTTEPSGTSVTYEYSVNNWTDYYLFTNWNNITISWNTLKIRVSLNTTNVNSTPELLDYNINVYK